MYIISGGRNRNTDALCLHCFHGHEVDGAATGDVVALGSDGSDSSAVSGTVAGDRLESDELRTRDVGDIELEKCGFAARASAARLVPLGLLWLGDRMQVGGVRGDWYDWAGLVGLSGPKKAFAAAIIRLSSSDKMIGGPSRVAWL